MFLHGIHPLRAVPRTRQERSAFFFDKTIIGMVRFENAVRLSSILYRRNPPFTWRDDIPLNVHLESPSEPQCQESLVHQSTSK